MGRLVRGSLAVAVLAVATLTMTGCGGDWYEDDYCYDDYSCDDDYSYQKTLFVYLNVADQDGRPLNGATVWVDGSQEENRTDGEYRELGQQFPPDWRGWKYNWAGGPYWIDLRDWANRRATIEILVSKTGYDTQRTTLSLTRYDPDETYMRQTFVMERQVGPASVARIVDAPQPPETISLK